MTAINSAIEVDITGQVRAAVCGTLHRTIGALGKASLSLVHSHPTFRRHPTRPALPIHPQVVADSIGTQIYSGVGGQMDFIRGAGLCPDGRPIIALPATTKKGESRIVPFLKPGGGIVTTRAHGACERGWVGGEGVRVQPYYTLARNHTRRPSPAPLPWRAQCTTS